MVAALREVQKTGQEDIETYSPYPVVEAERDLGYRTTALTWIAVGAATVAAAATLGMQYWMNGIDYPLNVGGRPLWSWPAFIPAAIIVGILAPAAATLLGMLFLCGLPRLHHPVFDVPGFERATADRFFLHVRARDPRFDAEAIAAVMRRHGAVAVREIIE